MSQARDERMMMISAPARSIMDHYDVHFRGSLVALICRRCKYLLVVPAATPAPDIADVGAIHNRLVHPDHAPRP